MSAKPTVATTPVLACPVCGATTADALFLGHDWLHGLPGDFPVVRCTVCDSRYLRERPTDLSAYYPAETYAAYQPTNQPRHVSQAIGRNRGLAARCRLMNQLKPGGALLDIGCGAGDFLSTLQAFPHWQVTGIEPSPTAAEAARDRHGLSVITGGLPQPDLAPAQFDIITLWHVFEHLEDLSAALAEIRRLLKPDGVLVIAVPVADSLEARWFGPHWAGYDVPRHLVSFTSTSLTDLLRRHGFAVQRHTGVIAGFASLRLSLIFSLRARGVTSPRWQAWLALLALPLAYPLIRLRSPLADVAVFSARP